jgi:S-adenosylmethionine:tRNA ribosyltransferase-isomerase
MMVLRRGCVAASSAQFAHRAIADLPDLLTPGTVVVINDSRVRKARLFGRSRFGGRVEFLFVEQAAPNRWWVLPSRAGRQRPGNVYELPGGVSAEVGTQDGRGLKLLRLSRPLDDEYFTAHGHVPLPPYIRRPDDAADARRYQTVYAEHIGSIAAPTAGLHLTETIIDRLHRRGAQVCRVTLHVGLGTFVPIRTEEVESHTMHEESYQIPEETARTVTAAKREGRPVLAVGTTSVRALESAWSGPAAQGGAGGGLRAGPAATRLYITPGYRFGVVDAVLTNFHTPGSTLLAMVAAFVGLECAKRAYSEAVRLRYRFFSYGDAMLVLPREGVEPARAQ